MLYREAIPDDIAQLQEVRASVQENVLADPSRITADDYREYLTERGKGWVCVGDKRIAGFAIVDCRRNNIWALFVNPCYPNKGIGTMLHDLMLAWYFSQTKKTVWLSTEAVTKAEKFYRDRGWQDVGTYGKHEIKFEMAYRKWKEVMR